MLGLIQWPAALHCGRGLGVPQSVETDWLIFLHSRHFRRELPAQDVALAPAEDEFAGPEKRSLEFL